MGDAPDSRTMSTLEDNGIDNYVHQGRKVQVGDFAKFDYIFAMDRSNLSDLQAVQRRAKAGAKAQLMLYGEFSGTGKAEVVEDPYYGGREGFEKAYRQCLKFGNNFLEKLAEERK